jgi:phosphopantothenoylcysteine decarboxylase/phosphopantothenate--cysteine ligase
VQQSIVEQPLAGKNIVLGVTGSIAAYKAAELASLLRKSGADVLPVMTKAAAEFITPLTLQTLCRNPVALDLWQEGRGWQPGHIDLADSADLLLVAPASADVLARFAHGLADDVLTSLYLACTAPVLIAPAMNGKMYEHPATQNAIRILTERGHHFLGPEEGMQACGYTGLGRLWPVDKIAEYAERLLTSGHFNARSGSKGIP